jgi:hypothetical protein
MGSYLGIATVTAVFAQKIKAALRRVENLSAAPDVVTKRPEKYDNQMVGAYLYLYDITFNNYLRNNDLTTRNAKGDLTKQPQVALNLRYHISFYGQDTTLEAQRMMGATIVELHAEPLITPQEVKQYLEAAGPDSVLASSTLFTQDARIKIEPISLSIEDVTKMWSSFFQQPHEHSLNYEISVLLMESDFPIEKAESVKSVGRSVATTKGQDE